MEALCSIPLSMEFKCLKSGEEVAPKQCQGCSFTAVSQLRHLRHAVLSEKQCYGRHCDHCYCIFSTQRELQSHIKTQHAALKDVTCPFCDYKCTLPRYLKKHLLIKHLTDEEKAQKWHQCERCAYQTPAKASLKDHIARKHPNSPLKCTLCGIEPRNKRALAHHFRVQHTPNLNEEYKCGREGFKCLDCDYKNKSMYRIRIHIRAKHLTDEEKRQQWLQCASCEFRCPERRVMNAHNFSKHSDKTELEWLNCDSCQYKTKVRHNLVNHIRVYHTTREVKCQFCDSFMLIRYLQSHIAKAHKEMVAEHSCQACGKAFTKKSCLARHVQAVHTPDQEKQYRQCPYCSFKTLRSLSFHILIKHNKDEAQYHHCTFCKYKSLFPTNVKRHIVRRHSKDDGMPWLPCSLCEFESRTKKYLRDHMRKKHGLYAKPKPDIEIK